MDFNIGFILIFAAILVIYGSIVYYIGLRSIFLVLKIFPFINSKLFWICYVLFAFSFVVLRFIKNILPKRLEYILNVFSSYSIAILLYLLLIYISIDVLRFIDKKIAFIPANVRISPYSSIILGVLVFLSVVSLMIYGAKNAKNYSINRYDVNISKNAGSVKNLHAVVVSDIHINGMTNKSDIIKMVQMINSLKPDIVLIVGDIIDEDFAPFLQENYSNVLGEIKAKYNTFGVLGNHDYFGGNSSELKKELQKRGIRLLTDEVVTVDDSIYIAGREDKSTHYSHRSTRNVLSDIIKEVDMSKPVILLEHQPSELNESIAAKIDLQLSGHTHAGQMFPINLITGMIFEKDWGYFKKGDFQLIVSSGFGTWGPPIRIGNRPEIVDLIINFND